MGGSYLRSMGGCEYCSGIQMICLEDRRKENVEKE